MGRGGEARGEARMRLFLWPGRALYLGPLGDTSVHAHHAVQVGIALDGTFRLRTHAGARWRRYTAAMIASDQPHQLDGGDALLALLYLDPEGSAARRLQVTAGATGIVRLTSEQLGKVPERLRRYAHRGGPEAQAEKLCTALADALTADGPARRAPDPRVERALALLQDAPNRRASAADIAAAVGLSPSRLGHLFSDHVGLPLRRYLLWLRLQDAVQELAAGAPATEAAHGAGFADSAHLSRTFRRMFGITPSDLARSQFVQA